MDNLLEVKDLQVEFHSGGTVSHAVNGISFSLANGETLGIVGETGAGKTTTALAIMRLLPKLTARAQGEIRFDGENLMEIDENSMRLFRGERLSMIFQDPMTSLNPVMTVGDQIAEGLRCHSNISAKEVDARVDDILTLVGIPPERKKEYPHQFSGGMKQRVVIAIALVCAPELLIADEPTTALDVTIQAQILKMMNELKKKHNTAMIMITHDLGIVAEMCDKVAIMYAGEIIESGSLDDIYNSQEHHPYTVGLFGAIPDLTKDTDRLSPIPGLMPEPADLPTGCKFHPRCPHCQERCKVEQPRDVKLGSHTIKCHLFEKEAGI